jgi:hypothetical protein
VAVAAFVGADSHAWHARIGFGAIGLVHGVLQLALPLLLVAFAPPRYVAAALAILIPAAVAGYWLAKHDRRWLLLIFWMAVGTIELALAISGAQPRPLTLYTLFAAGLLDMLLSCTWFGWYLAVAAAFNGHNNEVGGASRVERFKQLVRIKLAPDSLTAYVIAFDRPQVNARTLRVWLEDVFELQATPAAHSTNPSTGVHN